MSCEIRISKRAKQVVADDGSSLSWEGVVFIPLVEEGEKSAREFLRIVSEIGVAEAIKRLKGFHYAVYEDPSGQRFAFVDNCGYFCAYRSEKLVSPDFPDYLDRGDFDLKDIDLPGMTDLIREGNLYFERTPLRGVERVSADALFIARPDSGRIEVERKGLSDVFAKDEIVRGPDEIIGESLESFRGRKIAIDLSGGLDTRLTLAFFLKKGIPFTAMSHGLAGHPDIEIPIKLARIGAFDYRPFYNKPDGLIDYSSEIFANVDYLSNGLSMFSDFEVDRILAEEGYDLRVKSGLAVMLRDFWMLSDWPFMRKRKSNIDRLYSMRMKQKRYPELFRNSSLEELDESFDDNIVKELKRRYSMSQAYQTNEACAFKFRYRAGGGRFLTAENRIILTFPLYCDYELMRSAANMPFQDKRMNRFFREQLSKVSPELARIRTDRRQSFRNSDLAILFDRLVLVFDLIGRMYRKMRYRVTGKPMRKSLTPPEIDSVVRKLPEFPEALKILQSANLINPELDLTHIPTGKIGNIIAAAEIVKRLS